MPRTRSLEEALAEDASGCPCDDGCPLRDQCQRWALACPDYLRWFREKGDLRGDRFPLRSIYERIFHDAGEVTREPAVVSLGGERRHMSVWLSKARATPAQLADLAASGVNLTRWVRAHAGT